MRKGKSLDGLWTRFRKGDTKAFSFLYETFYSDLYNYSLKLTGDRDMALDAIHNTFTYMWQNRNQLNEVSAIKFYLIRSVRHQCLAQIKVRNREGEIGAEETHINMIILPQDLKLHDNSKEVSTKIGEALNTLSKRQREIIYLKFFNNLDYAEIAELLSINYQSVVNSIHRSIIKLRQLDLLKYLNTDN